MSRSEAAAFLVPALPQLARAVRDAVGATSVRVSCNCGVPAGQFVPHVHWHVLPRDGHKEDAFESKTALIAEVTRQRVAEHDSKVSMAVDLPLEPAVTVSAPKMLDLPTPLKEETKKEEIAQVSQRAALRKKLWLEWKTAPRPVPKTKELRECFAFFNRTERLLKRKKLIVDMAGGHGALGLAIKVHHNHYQKRGRGGGGGGGAVGSSLLKVVIGDLHCPDSFFNLRKAWLLEEEGTKNEVKHLKIDIRDRGWLERLLKAENINASDCGVVGCHVCNALSDELIDECLNAHVEFFVMGCCHGSTSRQGKSYKESAKELGVSLGLLVDTARYGVIAQREGYVAKIRTIDSKITPENRILIGLYDERETEEASVKHSKEALRKVAKVYERVFSKERLVEKDEE